MHNQKFYYSVFLFLSFLFSARAQDTISRDVKGFSEIRAMGKIRVELYRSDQEGIKLFVQNTNPGNVITDVTDNILHIRLKTGTEDNANVRVELHFTSLSNITVEDNCLLVSAEPLTGNSYTFTGMSGAKMEMELNVTEIKADVKQGAILVFRGSTKSQTIHVSTGATYSAYQLKSEDTYVSASTGSKAKVCASRIIKATASSKSYIGYIGTPVSSNIKTNLGGEIASFSNEDEVFEN